ncbi:MAG: GMC family oxidoreductase N-terminal domain-containing protein [Gammaproteobacteria bacterium]|nr:GMC family oxidoreductase N-terminal domain-containing protein [Gammaproteobacteria bacterium]
MNREPVEEYDYIIVGSGAAGAVVASRLAAATKASICVLEAGDSDRHPLVRIPAGFVKNLNNPARTWQFRSVAGDNTAGRQVHLPQGKILGGSTSINGLIYNRGQAADFDSWAALGNTGWSYQDVLPYFRRSESRAGEESQYRGAHGELRISNPSQQHPLCDAFISAMADQGLPTHNDYNAEAQRGTGYYQRFIHGRTRETVARAMLAPAARKFGIDVHTGALVTKIHFSQRRAIAVDVRQNNASRQLRARREIILSAGTVNTSRLLELSGVGQAERLTALGIPLVHDLPGVGENFQDHYFVRLAARLKAGTSTLNSQAKGWRLLREIARWSLGQPSILTWSPSIAYAFINASDPAANPDLQFVFSHGSYKPGRVYELDDFPAITCGFTQQRPESRGYVHITSPDIDQPPEVQPNYLSTDNDQRLAVDGIRLARKIMGHAVFQPWFEREEAPGEDLQRDSELLDYARRTGNTGYHLVGTCTMGPATQKTAVVSPELKVHGLQGLRVIDASVMPAVTSSNTCAASIMIGEKGADLVIADA